MSNKISPEDADSLIQNEIKKMKMKFKMKRKRKMSEDAADEDNTRPSYFKGDIGKFEHADWVKIGRAHV